MAALNLAGTYVREVRASTARIRENVLDWEHLPALHASSFAACELVDSDADGWRIRLVNQPGDAGAAQVLKLCIAADTSRYCVTTESGPGAGSEIRVTVTPRGPHETGIVVEYHVPEADPARLAMIGRGFVAIYKQLWDEDEAMMLAREAALAPRPRIAVPARLDLGAEADVRAALPLAFDFGPGRFRLVDSGGTLAAHSLTCPHWLGPLDTAVDADGCVTCPWHGYRFDVASGRSADGHGLRLAPAPAIRIENARVVACG
jgi:nitrite reductase/ring-hydroxylating ferredoxin subunit